ncbi:MAG: SpvB/TcaC N-terminal domain-containing protein [Nitrospirota bacterium]
MSAKAGSNSEFISVPKGGGALKGLGEKFSPDLHTGTGNFSVPIALPPGRNGFQPQLTLGFSTGSGNGPFGLGWSLSIPGVSRLTSKGIPRYGAAPPDRPDIFVLSGAEDLVEVSRQGDIATYRPRTEGLFARITHHKSKSPQTDHWEVATKDGLVSIYGTPNNVAPAEAARDTRAVIADPKDRDNIFAWRLSETHDPFGNRITYEYDRDTGSDRGRHWDQLYLQRIRYVDLGGPNQAEFLVSVEFLYDDASPPGVTPEVQPRVRSDPYSDYRASFEIRTRRRCKWIVVRTHPAKDRAILVRAYEFVYLDEQTSDLARLPLNGASLLSRINVIGYDDAGVAHRELPPLDFGYSRFEPQGRKFIALQGADLPATSLSNPDLELVDLFGHGLPDIVELGGAVRYWRNLGHGRYDRPRQFAQAPASWKLSDVGVQLLDANGDGRADLLVTNGEQAGYYPMDFGGRFSKKIVPALPPGAQLQSRRSGSPPARSHRRRRHRCAPVRHLL